MNNAPATAPMAPTVADKRKQLSEAVLQLAEQIDTLETEHVEARRKETALSNQINELKKQRDRALEQFRDLVQPPHERTGRSA